MYILVRLVTSLLIVLFRIKDARLPKRLFGKLTLN